MRSVRVVLPPPGFNLPAGVFEREEPVQVQALVTEAPVERFNVGIIGRFARPREVERDGVVVGHRSSALRDVRAIFAFVSANQATYPVSVGGWVND